MSRPVSRLVRVELRRLVARRAVLLLLAAAVLIPALIGITRVLETEGPSEHDRAEATAQAERDAARPAVRKELERCVARPGRYGVSSGDDVQAQCEEMVLPRPEWYFYWDELTLAQEQGDSGVAVVAVLGVLLFLMGTTFAGHDWNTGAMSNQLLFEPRRTRVWAAKAAAVALMSALVAFVVVTAFWLTLAAVVSSRDGDASSELLLDALQSGWRGAGLAVVAGLGGYALTMLSRSTVFSIGALAGVAVAGGLLPAAVGPTDPGPVDPTINALAVVKDGVEYWVEVPQSCFTGRGNVLDRPECDESRVRELGPAVGYFAVLLGVLGAGSLLSFRRRDVP